MIKRDALIKSNGKLNFELMGFELLTMAYENSNSELPFSEWRELFHVRRAGESDGAWLARYARDVLNA